MFICVKKQKQKQICTCCIFFFFGNKIFFCCVLNCVFLSAAGVWTGIRLLPLFSSSVPHLRHASLTLFCHIKTWTGSCLYINIYKWCLYVDLYMYILRGGCLKLMYRWENRVLYKGYFWVFLVWDLMGGCDWSVYYHMSYFSSFPPPSHLRSDNTLLASHLLCENSRRWDCLHSQHINKRFRKLQKERCQASSFKLKFFDLTIFFML